MAAVVDMDDLEVKRGDGFKRGGELVGDEAVKGAGATRRDSHLAAMGS